ncbi:phosphotransferase [Actinotignum urinale]|uniref:phosphotransferase n=1 Tax=Actinotignum urinale TaxID=190146 RepID=UPI00370D8EE5
MGFNQEKYAQDVLTGNDASYILACAYPNLGITYWEVNAVNHRPGAGVTVSYRVGTSAREYYMCATTAKIYGLNTPTLQRVDFAGLTIHVWQHPNDPELPALPVAVSTKKMRELMGMPVNLELKGYRPTRRAVVKVTPGDGSRGGAFVKVLRPPVAQSLAKRHRMLTQAGVSAPRVLREDPRGLVLISQMSGEPLANFLSRGLGRRAPDVLESLWALLERLPISALNLTHRPAWSDRVGHYAHAAAVALPRIEMRARNVAQGVEAIMRTTNPGPIVPVHGDFYEANIFVRNGMSGTTYAGVIDVDSLGPGYRIDDWACLLGHMSVLPHLAPSAYPDLREDLATWVSILERRLPPAPLFARCAGVVLSLVAGAARQDGTTAWQTDAMGRISEAENWLHRAQRSLQTYM